MTQVQTWTAIYLFIYFFFFIKLFTCSCWFSFVKLGVALTFLLTALELGLFALFAFALAAELQNANGEEDCQNPKANQHPHRL